MSPSNPFAQGPNTPYGSKDSPFYTPSTEEILKHLGFGNYLASPPLKLMIISDNTEQTTGFLERLALAGERFLQLAPVVVRPRIVAQRFFDVKEITQQAAIDNSSPTVVGLCLLVLFCKTEPADLVLGIGQEGQPLVADLKREAPSMYPDQAQKFVTQTELEQEASRRFFADEPDAFLLVAYERLYKTKIAERHSAPSE